MASVGGRLSLAADRLSSGMAMVYGMIGNWQSGRDGNIFHEIGGQYGQTIKPMDLVS